MGGRGGVVSPGPPPHRILRSNSPFIFSLSVRQNAGQFNDKPTSAPAPASLPTGVHSTFQGFPTKHADVWFQFKGKWHKGKVQELIPVAVAIEATEFPYAKIIVRYADGAFEHTRQNFAKAKYGAGTGVRWALCKAQQPQPQPQPQPAPAPTPEVG